MFSRRVFSTCPAKCKCCDVRCSLQLKHSGPCSAPGKKCIYSAQYENKIYTCQRCQENGRRSIVVSKSIILEESSIIGLAKFAWSGYVLEYELRSVGSYTGPDNSGLWESQTLSFRGVQTEIAVARVRSLQGTQNAARRLLD